VADGVLRGADFAEASCLEPDNEPLTGWAQGTVVPRLRLDRYRVTQNPNPRGHPRASLAQSPARAAEAFGSHGPSLARPILQGEEDAAAAHIRTALGAYDVQAIDTLIGDITPPAELMTTQTDRKIAEEQRKTYEVQQLAQEQRQKLVKETAVADIQKDVVKAQQGVSIAELEASARVKAAVGDAEGVKLAIRATSEAKAEAYRPGVTALGPQSYTAVQLMQIVGEKAVRVVPDVSVSGNGSSLGLAEGLLGMLVRDQAAPPTGRTQAWLTCLPAVPDAGPSGAGVGSFRPRASSAPSPAW